LEEYRGKIARLWSKQTCQSVVCKRTCQKNGRNPSIWFVIRCSSPFSLLNQNSIVNALHPGVIRSELFRSENPFLVLPIMAFARNIENGALTSLYVATSPDIEKKNIRGAYFKPSATLPAPFIRPAICTPSAKARDATLATKLWQLSERLVGLSK
jgi:hypothetical protein